jgi:putative transcriptional regulator
MTDRRAAPSSLRSLSRFMAGLTTIGLLIYPAGDIAIYLRPQVTQWLMLDADHMGRFLNDGVPLVYRLCALAFSLAGVSFTVWALWSLRRLFLHYSRGDVFSADALRLMENIAIAIFAGVIVSFAGHAPISLALTWYLGHGHLERQSIAVHGRRRSGDFSRNGGSTARRRRKREIRLMAIVVNLDVMMARRKMRSKDVAEAIDITEANLSLLKSGKVKGVRFSTLEKICVVLECQPGDILEFRPDA